MAKKVETMSDDAYTGDICISVKCMSKDLNVGRPWRSGLPTYRHISCNTCNRKWTEVSKMVITGFLKDVHKKD